MPDNLLTLFMLNKDATPISNFQPVRLLDPDCEYKFTYLMANSAGTDLDLHCLQRQGISGFIRTRVKKHGTPEPLYKPIHYKTIQILDGVKDGPQMYLSKNV